LKATSLTTSVTASNVWVQFPFSSALEIISGKNYDIILKPSTASSAVYSDWSYLVVPAGYSKFMMDPSDSNILGTTSNISLLQILEVLGQNIQREFRAFY
jgi:hypothetical protein